MTAARIVLTVLTAILWVLGSLLPGGVEKAWGQALGPMLPPACDGSSDLSGQVVDIPGGSASDFKVATLLFLEGVGWWSKPTSAAPYTPLQADGSFQVDITTGGCDASASRFAVRLLPQAASCPLAASSPTLPDCPAALDNRILERPCSTLSAFGRTWHVKDLGTCLAGPGPNHFSQQSAWVDAAGLHLAVREVGGSWQAGEVILAESLGHGTASFTLESRIDLLDPNVVLGVFSFDPEAPLESFREIDVELSRWGDPGNENGQYVVQPYTVPENLFRFDVDYPEATSTTTHVMTWTPTSVQFTSYRGAFRTTPPTEVLASWRYGGATVPTAGGERIHLNLWLLGGTPPLDGMDAEVVISDFDFFPPTACSDGQDDDGDGGVDFDPVTLASPGDVSNDPAGHGDPGCRGPTWNHESPQCQNGQHDDGDGRIDHDGGRSVLGTAQTPPDPQCVGKPWKSTENSGCGLGGELVFLLPLWTVLARGRPNGAC